MKKTFLCVFLSVLLIALPSCAGRNTAASPQNGTNNADPSDVQTSSVRVPFDRIIEDMPVILSGTCTGVSYNDEYSTAVLSFDIQNVYQGEYDPGITEFRAISSDIFSAGKEYVLFCRQYASVFEQKDFYSVGITVYEDGGRVVCERASDLSFASMEAVRAHISDYAAKHPFAGDASVTGDYCRSEDLREIFEYSSNVLAADIKAVVSDDSPGRTVYSFDLVESLKGEVKGETMVVALKGSMEVGKRYLLLLSQPDPGAEFFVVSSPLSVLADGSEDAGFIRSLTK